MPLYMDVHSIARTAARDVAEAQCKARATQDWYGVRYLRYWVAEDQGKVFCLVNAPNVEAAATVHQVAHGLVADEIYRVEEGT